MLIIAIPKSVRSVAGAIVLALAFAVSFTFTGCLSSGGGSDKKSSTDGTKKGDGSDGDTEPEPLSFFEEELPGEWYRYHGYDDTEWYLYLYVDRTGCYWEEPSSGGRTAQETYTNWYLDEDSPVVADSRFYLMVETADSSAAYDIAQYDYPLDSVWWGGYDNLDMYQTSYSSGCE